MKNAIARTVTLLLANTLILLCVGCQGPDGQIDGIRTAEALRAAGFSGNVSGVWGNSHAAGVTWNLSGSHGWFEIVVDPAKANRP